MDSRAPAPLDPAAHSAAEPASAGSPSRWSAVSARLRLGAGAVVVLLLLALAAAVLVSLLTPAGTGATLERRPSASQPAVPAPTGTARPGGDDGAGDRPGPSAAAPDTPIPERPVLVHVLGSVAHSGLYELPVGARVVDAVAAAGGLAPGADQARINLARTVADGEQLYVPAVGEVVPVPATPPGAVSPGGSGASATETGIVDLNTATVDDLDTLPRIGPELAQRIVDWRSANGRFEYVEDLLEVPGIGDRTFEGLRERVRV